MHLERRQRFRTRDLICALAGAALAAPLAGQTSLPQVGFRVKIENRRFGKIEIARTGSPYVIVGRVLQPVLSTSYAPKANAAGVLSTSPLEVEIGLKGHRSFAFTAAPTATANRHTITRTVRTSAAPTNLTPGESIFGGASPNQGATVALLVGSNEFSLPEDYVPSDGDTLVVTASISRARAEDTHWDVDIARAYTGASMVRAKRFGVRVVSGDVVLEARLPRGEPDPIEAVTFLIDGETVDATNSSPYLYEWNTHAIANGEHEVEIDALNSQGALVTATRALVVVNNVSPRPLVR